MMNPDQTVQRSVTAMAEEYPELVLRSAGRGDTGAVWEGTVQPIQSADHVAEILDDLHLGRELAFPGVRVAHWDNCTANHSTHQWMNRLRTLEQQFTLQIRYTGGRPVPRCYVLEPEISSDKTPHMWSDGAICAFLVSEVWMPGRTTVADLMPHYLAWLVKWMVFEQTRKWIGPDHVHGPAYHLDVVGRNELCWCGSGRKYKKCHRPDEEVAKARGPVPLATPEKGPWRPFR